MFSSKDLNQLCSEGDFREDLYHRLNVVPINVPSLQSRISDIPILINYFKKKISELNNIDEAEIDTNNDLLYTYDWPGNIRELRNLVERVSILSVNENNFNSTKLLQDILRQTPDINLGDQKLSQAMSYPLKEAREEFEKKYLLNQLKKNHGNISKTASYIGMERSALHRKLKSLGIKDIN